MRKKIFLALLMGVFCLLLIFLIASNTKAKVINDVNGNGTPSPSPSPTPTPTPTPTPFTIEIKNPLVAENFEDIINNLIDFVFNIAIVLTPLMIILGGVLFVTAAGNLEQVTRAKKIIIWTLVGFFIVLLAKGISDLIATLLGISG